LIIKKTYKNQGIQSIPPNWALFLSHGKPSKTKALWKKHWRGRSSICRRLSTDL